ncbi:transcriptional regulator [Pseudoprimorskyibacter insulae]|nr:transcriptional regulator [Pseudoprimorskyibacter insulae]
MSRSRRWLEDKLWSRSGGDQASTSLRQALSKLRKSSPELSEILTTDRASVSLDSGRVARDLDDPTRVSGAELDLLEGLDARDVEFEDWLRQERATFAKRISSAPQRKSPGLGISCVINLHSPGADALGGEILADAIGSGIAEQVRAWRSNKASTDFLPGLPSDIEIACNVLERGGKTNVYLKVIYLPTGRILHSRLHEIGTLSNVLNSSEPVAALIFDVADRVVSQIPLVMDNNRPEVRATAMSRLGMYRLFSFEAEGMDEAETLFRQAHEIDPNPVYLAWRSFTHVAQLIERTNSDSDAAREQSIETAYRALEQGRENSLVLSLIGQVRMMAMQDTEGGMELAKQALSLNPANAFAWSTCAFAHMRAGNLETALRYSQLGRRVARFSPFRQWWEVNHCVISLACNRLDDAIIAGEAAARTAPALRPAHRHLVALYAQKGDFEKAKDSIRALERVETGFSLDRFLNDDRYPVATIRAHGLLKPARSLL